MADIYRFHVEEQLDPDWSARLAGLVISHRPDGTSYLQGPVQDQAALYGLIFQLQDLGVSLIGLQRLDFDSRKPETN